MSQFHIRGNCLKVPNKFGQVISLGGDDNCRGDGVRDRLSVIFESANGEDYIPVWLTPEETTELSQNKELTVWNDPDRYASLLNRHLNYGN